MIFAIVTTLTNVLRLLNALCEGKERLLGCFWLLVHGAFEPGFGMDDLNGHAMHLTRGAALADLVPVRN